ncbi:glycosyltransferase family 1 protein [Altericroceibacterium spongiae]|uniref:Glycosyltransferase family 1 protein n=1 Tax=Altericroceibacterium spongiae TaxID=2320269 RepID=A0A420EKP0_9SPHN|nr:glycosyltransferase family 4 protein [Altericroceibacterium spongiae]RKF21258.1 glycosyltransferase family 1 protein [Altericroceibacterium spongiae]
MAKSPLRPRFLHLHSTFDAGGKELRCVRLINAFGSAADHAIVSAEPAAMGAQSRLSRVANCRFPEFPSLKGKPTPGRLKKIAAAMRGYDLILTYNWGAMDAVMAHTLFADVYQLPPLVHHEDGFNADEAVKLKTSRNIYRRIALGRSAALVVPSRKLEDIALNIWQQPRSRVQRIANGIPTQPFGRKPKADALPSLVKRNQEYWVGTIAGLRAVKNLPALVRAMDGLGDHWHLVICGEGPEKAAIIAEAERLNMDDRVHLPGHIAEPEKVIGLFDIFALSSQSEQFPISVVEAMAAGLPVVAPDVGDIADMVALENRDCITPPGDEDALTEMLQRLAADPQSRGAIGKANREKARTEYDEKQMIARYRSLYWGLMGRNALRSEHK